MELDLIGLGIKSTVSQLFGKVFSEINSLDLDSKITIINKIKRELHNLSPFKDQPVDCVIWVKNETVEANDYNPNSVAPPEMELLKDSILEDGYTQPIVTFCEEDKQIVVDGFHRTKIGKECKEVKKRVNGFVPVVVINEQLSERCDRIASTIRHNRARGKHTIDGMSNIVI